MKTTVYCDVQPQWYKKGTNFSSPTTESICQMTSHIKERKKIHLAPSNCPQWSKNVSASGSHLRWVNNLFQNNMTAQGLQF